ncbi:DUF2922 domain-containing protein [Carnobacterium mobile]|uniref:DUF2922 domain-containing protein n=1 Tax=Carnobacterium mobile TaxID=2750 RepID=UPI000551F008|nr:DUF2922 domain-containing protein [Carnobacterium mobile]
MAKSLELRFNTSLGKAKTMSVQDPVLDLSPEDAQKAMADIIALDLFEKEGVNLYTSVVGARYVERVVEDIFEVE